MNSDNRPAIDYAELTDDQPGLILYNCEQSIIVERRWRDKQEGDPSYFQRRIDTIQTTLNEATAEWHRRAQRRKELSL